jgi:hypothetical protein
MSKPLSTASNNPGQPPIPSRGAAGHRHNLNIPPCSADIPWNLPLIPLPHGDIPFDIPDIPSRIHDIPFDTPDIPSYIANIPFCKVIARGNIPQIPPMLP